MKSLYLMRHGKSSWEIAGLVDRERPLLEKGIDRTERRAKELKKSGVRLDAIWTSDAVRAVQTAEIVRKEFGLEKESVFVDPLIYDADRADELRKVVRSFPDDFESILLVGHNPLITEFAQLFFRDLLDDMKTSQVVAVEFADWTNLRRPPLI